jgi:Na+/proline symporter
MKTADWIVVGSSILLMLAMAVFTAIRTRGAEEYFTAGRRVRRLLLIFFAFGSGTSSDSQSSVVAGTWRAGLSGLWWQFLWLPITPFYWIVAPLLRRLRAITTADFFAMRFGPSTAALYSVYGMVISVVFMAGVLFGGARLVNTLTDPLFSDLSSQLQLQIPLIDVASAFDPPSVERQPMVTWRQVAGIHLAAACLAVLIVLLAVIGGLHATILIDALQGLLRIGLTLLLLPLIFQKIGGFGAIFSMEYLKPGMFDFVASSDASVSVDQEPFTPFYLCMLSVAALVGIIVQPHIIAVCGAGRTEMDSRIGFTFGSLLKRSMAVAWSFMGLACIVWYLGPASPLISVDATVEQRQLHEQLNDVSSGNVETLTVEQRANISRTDFNFADQLLGRVSRDILGNLSPGLLGLMLAMAVAAAISHCGTQMIVGSGLFAEHLYRYHIAPGREPGHYMAIGRLCGPVLVLMALLLQTTFTDITDFLKLVIKTPAVIGISMWMGLIWFRWNTISVWTTTLSAAVLGILCGYYPEEIQKSVPDFLDQMFLTGTNGLVMIDAWKIVCILSGGLFCGVIASILTEPQHDDMLEHFYRVIRTPVTPDEVAQGRDFLPPEDTVLVPAVCFAGFQFPGPTKVGSFGFVLAWLIVIAMIVGTKWLSLQL